MSETKRTWKAVPCPCGHVGCRRFVIDGLVGSDGRYDKDDARLIATAPDLLAALNNLLRLDEIMESEDGVDADEYKVAMHAANAAIAKAEGRDTDMELQGQMNALSEG